MNDCNSINNDELTKKPVLLKEIVYTTGGKIQFNGVLCDPRTVRWSEKKVGNDRILSIRAISVNDYPLYFECIAHGKKFGSFDENGSLIDVFKNNIGKQIYRVNLINSIKEGSPAFISTPVGIILKNGEGALLNASGVTYSQQKTKTEYYHGGASYKLTKRLRISGGKTTPVKKNYTDIIDRGSLILTNKRLVFLGQNKSVTIELSKILDIDFYSNALDITKDGVQTKYCFSGVDGNTFYGIIMALCTN